MEHKIDVLPLSSFPIGTIPNCQGVLKDFDITTQNEPEPLLFTTLKSCCNACKKDSNCKAWVWSSSQATCWLKSEVGNRFYSKTSQNLYSGYPGERLGTERSCHGVAKGVDIIPGANDISPVIPNSNIESCCNSCNNEFRCKGWVLNTEDSKCYLKTVDTPWVPNTKTISALPGYIGTFHFFTFSIPSRKKFLTFLSFKRSRSMLRYREQL